MAADVFISYASEDREAIAEPLARALKSKGLTVWYDEAVLKLGDGLRQAIEHGLSSSRFGVVILSPSFFARQWPRRELDALLAREDTHGVKVLPVLHGLTREDVIRLAPLVADKLAVSTDRGLEAVVERILSAIDSQGTAGMMDQPGRGELVSRMSAGWKTAVAALLLVAIAALAILVGARLRRLDEPARRGSETVVQPSPSASDSEIVAQPSPAARIGLGAAVERTSTDRGYQVRLSWPPPASETAFQLARSRLDGVHESVPVQVPWVMGEPSDGKGPQSDRAFVDSGNILPFTRYRYTLRAERGAVVQRESVDVTIPGNKFEIEGRKRLAELDLERRFPIDRLVVRQGAELLTEGEDLRVDVVELIGEGGVIRTFPAESVARAGNPGRAGGSISLRAVRGSGNLTVYGDGERGGKGNTGRAGARGGKGHNGRDSQSRGSVHFESVPCVVAATDGGSGGKGKVGDQGGSGFAGGDSASVEVLILERSPLQVRVLARPGEGGEGGDGGAGGPGGPGGDGGDASGGCKAGNDGLPGPPGPAGLLGSKGERGRRLSCCVRVGDTTEPDCPECGG
jgi:TIR domain-containing protein